MRLGPLDIKLARTPVVKDSQNIALVGVPESTITLPLGDASKGASLPVAAVTAAKLDYGKYTRPGGTDEWNSPEFDFKKIAQALATEAFFRRITDKYIELIWRNGYALTGDNNSSVEYITERLEQIAMVTSLPTDVLFRSMSQQMVTYSNCFTEKARKLKASGGRIRTTFDGKHLIPVAGYFVIDATSVLISKDKHGKVLRYKQEIKNSRVKAPTWLPKDLIHIYKDKEAGLSFGTPMVAPVIDDIQALRRIEENVEMLVFNHAIPLYQYLIGDEENKPTRESIDRARVTVRDMPSEGMLITPFYHEIRAIGAEGRALRCEGILDYFKNRVFSGLGTSEVAMGYSGSASRGAADTIERGMYNTVREYQNVFSIGIQSSMFTELLLEGGFNPYGEDAVKFTFPEIDIDDKVKVENHMINLFNGNLLTETEARIEIGRKPITDEQRTELFFNLIELPRAIVGAVDEPFLATYPNLLTRMSKGITGRAKSATALDMPSNQHGTKMSPGTTKDEQVVVEVPQKVDDAITVDAARLLERLNYSIYSSELCRLYGLAQDDAQAMLAMKYIDGYDEDGEIVVELLRDYDRGNLNMVMGLTTEEMIRASASYVLAALHAGVSDACTQCGETIVAYSYKDDAEFLAGKSREWIDRTLTVVRDASEELMRSVLDKSESPSFMRSLFESNIYRVRLGARNELQRAYNIGVYRGGMILGRTEFEIVNTPFDEDGKCSVHIGNVYTIGPDVDLNDIPPGYMTHPLCTCRIKLMA